MQSSGYKVSGPGADIWVALYARVQYTFGSIGREMWFIYLI
jgi:hypothetical protein